MQYDVFISHSSSDKVTIARPLSEALQQRGVSVWLDEEQLQVGDSIRRGIDAGLQNSRFGIVILSPAYLDSEWTRKELDALFSKEKQHNKTILPLFHEVELADIERFSPMLADKLALTTEDGVESLADRIQRSIQSQNNHQATRATPVTSRKHNRLLRFPSSNVQWLIATLLALAAIVIPTWVSLHSNPSPDASTSQARPAERDSSIKSQGDLKFEASDGGSVTVNTGDGQIIQKDSK